MYRLKQDILGKVGFNLLSGGTFPLTATAPASLLLDVQSPTTLTVTGGTITAPSGSGASVALSIGLYQATTVTGGWLIRQMDADHVSTADYATAALNMSATLPPESGWLWAFRGTDDKVVFGVRSDSPILPGTIDAAIEATHAVSSDAALTAGYAAAALTMEADLPPESGWLWAWKGTDDKVIFGFRADSSILPGTIDAALEADHALSADYLERAEALVCGDEYIVQQQDIAGVRKLVAVDRSTGVAYLLATSGGGYDPQIVGGDVLYYDAAMGRVMFQPLPTGEAYPVLPNPSISVFGDSLSASLGYHLQLWLPSVVVHRRGLGGRDSTEVVAIQGGLPTTVSGTIPASGAGAVTLSRDLLGPDIMSLTSIAGTIAGIAGMLARDGAGAYTFTRTTAGAALVIPGSTAFRSDYDLVGEVETNVWWWGRNDGPSNLTSMAAPNTMAAIAHLKTMAPRWLLLGVTTYASAGEASGTSNYNAIVAHNNALKTSYGDALASVGGRIFDVRRWLIDNGPALVAEQGLTWTASDAQCIAWDTIPTSLMNADLLHMTDDTQHQIAAKVMEILQEKGWV